MKKLQPHHLLLFILLLSVFGIGAVAQASCNPTGTPGDDNIDCTDTNNGNVWADAGNDTVTVETGATVNGTINGGGGNETVVNNGDVNGAPARDGITTNDGSAVVVNNGTIDSERDGIQCDAVTPDTCNIDNNGTINSTGVGIFTERSSNDTVTNDGTITSTTSDGMSLKGGDDIAVNNGTIDAGADGIAAGTGNDTVTNNGTIIADDEGVETNAGNDTVTNNGDITATTTGEGVNTDTGNDTVTNNGSITSVVSDGITTGGNDDTVVNNGTVDGGDVAIDAGTGNDQVTVNGDTNGGSGTDVDAGTGNDTVTLQNGALSTGDGVLLIGGGLGTDALVFDLVIIDDQTTYDSMGQTIATGGATGSLDFNTTTFSWTGFEQLVNSLLHLITPVAGFSPSVNSGPAPLAVSFNNSSTGTIDTYAWDFGDGNGGSGAGASHTYTTPGSYTVTLTVTGPLGSSSVSANVVVIGPPSASFGANPASGTAPLTVSFSNNSSGDITGYAWDFGDGGGSGDASPTYTFNNPGSYTVTLTATGPGGSASTSTVIVVNPPAPSAGFGANPTSGVAPLTVSFSDASSGSITGYAWDFGDGGGSGDANPTYTFNTPGTYTVNLTVTGPGGSSSASTVIVVDSPPPAASFSADPTSGTAPLTVNFTNSSAGSISSYAWDFGDGGSSDEQNPSHTYTEVGVYTATLTLTGPGGTSTFSITITVETGDPVFVSTDGRLNFVDTGSSPIAVYCTPGGAGVDVYQIDETSRGILAFRVDQKTIDKVLAEAKRTQKNVLVAAGMDSTLWALPSGNLSAEAPTLLEPTKLYTFVFGGDRCAKAGS